MSDRYLHRQHVANWKHCQDQHQVLSDVEKLRLTSIKCLIDIYIDSTWQTGNIAGSASGIV